MMKTETTPIPTEPPRPRPTPALTGSAGGVLQALAAIYREFGLTTIQARAAALADLRALEGGFIDAR